MKGYEKPIVLVNDGLSEGIYAGSGKEQPECWTIEAVSVQDWNGSHHVFEIRCRHSTDVVHISSATDVNLTFSNSLTNAYSEFEGTSFSDNTVSVHRELHANAYNSGDTMTYKVWVKAADEATTKAITCTNATITCTHSVNVQGGYD